MASFNPVPPDVLERLVAAVDAVDSAHPSYPPGTDEHDALALIEEARAVLLSAEQAFTLAFGPIPTRAAGEPAPLYRERYNAVVAALNAGMSQPELGHRLNRSRAFVRRVLEVGARRWPDDPRPSTATPATPAPSDPSSDPSPTPPTLTTEEF